MWTRSGVGDRGPCYFGRVGTEPANRPDFPGRPRVLVADDNADVRQLWRAFLTLSGFVVSEAANGMEALARALEDSPAVILMDFSMPGMDGAAAGRALKRDLRTAAIPVVGLTGHGPEAGVYHFQDVCDIVLEKPLNPEAVVDALRRALQRNAAAG